MSSGNDKSKRQRKIDNIFALLNGSKKPEDIFPKCKMYIGYGNGPKYKVNGKMVSKEVYDEAMTNMPEHGVFKISYGEDPI